VGISGAIGILDTPWDLPSGWKVPQQLRVLKISGASNEALSSLSSPSGNRLQLLYINWWLQHELNIRLPISPPASLFVNPDSLKVLHLNNYALQGLPKRAGAACVWAQGNRSGGMLEAEGAAS
jgi:hypothetical protein